MATVLPFPQTKTALRRRRGMSAAGFLTMLLMDRDGEAIPPNVTRFDEPEGPQLPDRSSALMLALFVWGELPKAKRDHIKQLIRCMAYETRPDPEVVRLHNMFTKKG